MRLLFLSSLIAALAVSAALDKVESYYGSERVSEAIARADLPIGDVSVSELALATVGHLDAGGVRYGYAPELVGFEPDLVSFSSSSSESGPVMEGEVPTRELTFDPVSLSTSSGGPASLLEQATAVVPARPDEQARARGRNRLRPALQPLLEHRPQTARWRGAADTNLTLRV